MKVRAILRSLLFSYAVTGIFLLLLAFLLFQFDLGEKPVSAGIVAVYILSCLLGGFMAGKIIRKDKYLWGILVGVFYYLLLITVSFAVKGKWDMSLMHAVTTFFMCLGGGALGGMLSRKKYFKNKKKYDILGEDNIHKEAISCSISKH